ncbi:MAG: BON domain-containing protein [Steroidobacteraceae bacterium]|jgi:osmotically-inducible protein OsmY
MTIRLTFCASVGAILFGWGGVVMRVDAQNSSAPPLSGTTVAVAQGDNLSGDQAVQGRVEAALYAAKYSLETHVKVSVEKGTVVLRGFVLSEWDRRHAMGIATKAAGGRKVIDDIHMKEGQAH